MSKLATVKKTVTGAGAVAALARPTGRGVNGAVHITALSTNTGKVQIGGPEMNGTTVEGIPLTAGQSKVFPAGEVDELSGIYVWVQTSGEGVTVTYSTDGS